MSLIKTITGEENQKEAIAKVHIWHASLEGNKTENFLSALAKLGTQRDGKTICAKHGPGNSITSVEGVAEEICKNWYEQTYEILDGEFLKIFAHIKPSWSGLRTSANMFVRVRRGAPFMKIRIPLLAQRKSKLAEATIIGKMDILTMEEAEEIGLKINPAYRHLFTQDKIDKLFRFEELEAATESKPRIQIHSVAGEDGEIRTVRIPKKGRIIEL